MLQHVRANTQLLHSLFHCSVWQQNQSMTLSRSLFLAQEFSVYVAENDLTTTAMPDHTVCMNQTDFITLRKCDHMFRIQTHEFHLAGVLLVYCHLSRWLTATVRNTGAPKHVLFEKTTEFRYVMIRCDTKTGMMLRTKLILHRRHEETKCAIKNRP